MHTHTQTLDALIWHVENIVLIRFSHLNHVCDFYDFIQPDFKS